MGRSRAVPNSGDDDTSHRSKRRRVAASGEALGNIEAGSGTSEGKKALYHCNYCNKDISGKIRIKCTKCADFDLCVECFSVGAEVTPHKSNHPYRVMDNLSFPLICPDWNADEEILLLEGIEMYGLGNWTEVAEHVGTKSKAQCIDHYTTSYLNSPCYPLPVLYLSQISVVLIFIFDTLFIPSKLSCSFACGITLQDMSRVNGKNRKELLAMAKVQVEGKKGSSLLGDVTPKEESPFSPARVKVEDIGEGAANQSPSNLAAGASKVTSNTGKFKDNPDGPKVEDSYLDRTIGVKKPKCSGEEGPSITESGYNPKRQEFDPEYDNDAEQALADMEFKENDTETERELKLRVLRIYLSRLDERKRRKDFILERNLLYPNPLEKELSSEDRELYNRFKVFMRFLSQEEHENLVKSVIEERKIRRRIQELQECRAAGCRTLAEAKAYTEQKRKRELEVGAQNSKENTQILSGGKVAQKANRPLNREKGDNDGSPRNTTDNHKIKGSTGFESSGKDSPSTTTGQVSVRSFDEWDITGLPGTEFLSETEQDFCCQNRLLPSHYLKMQETLVQEIYKGNIINKSDAHGLFKVDPVKVDKVYDIVKRKLGQQEESTIV
ncbi:transcriptional adapter ADA2-like isoform X1 [Musa acuminata AAA Group]|uniref:Transcriptional adapter n=1 Tax=Musa acuminata subsp. malaccensis TaxID=214687 RepID=A0A804JBL0_MUSAM|nr:PREDICTED: transcriptional adapter ADA2 isoform X1 [Musa acuminata subsp. malaccensis]